MSSSAWTPVADTSAWKPVDAGLSPHLRDIIRANPPSFPEEKSLNAAALSGMIGMPAPSFSPQQRQEFEQGKTEGGMATPGGGLITAGSGVGDVAKGDFSKGGSKIIRGGMTMAAPLVPEAALARPLMAARAIAGGYVMSKGAEAGAEALGATSDQKQFAGDIGNLTGSFAAASGLTRALLETPVKELVNRPGMMKLLDIAITEHPVSAVRRVLVGKLRAAITGTPEASLPTESATATGPISGEPTLPNATYLRPDSTSLSQQPPAPPKPNLLSGIREHEFLTKVQDELNRQGGDEQAQAEINKWIEDHNQQAPGAKPSGAATTAKAKFDAARAQAEGKANVVPGEPEAPTVAYRVRDAGETGILPRGHAQATTDLPQAKSYVEGRGQAQNAPQEIVKVDLSKLSPKDYTLKTGPGGKTWVQFKSAVPESFIQKVGAEEPQLATESNMEELLRKSIQNVKAKRASAKAGDD